MSKKQMSDSVKVVWFIWLQGIKNAPEICKACLNSWIEKILPIDAVVLQFLISRR